MKTSSAQSKVASIPSSSLKTLTEYPREVVLETTGAIGAKAEAEAARRAAMASFILIVYDVCERVIDKRIMILWWSRRMKETCRHSSWPGFVADVFPRFCLSFVVMSPISVAIIDSLDLFANNSWSSKLVFEV